MEVMEVWVDLVVMVLLEQTTQEALVVTEALVVRERLLLQLQYRLEVW
jgi:hypothetical protein